VINDCHTHVGFWENSFITPEWLFKRLTEFGVDHAAVMPTFSRNGDGYLDNDFELYDDIQENYSDFFDIILAVTPQRFEISHNLEIFEKIDYKAIKIHPSAQKWEINQKPIETIFSICAERNIPLMIHTSNDNSSNSTKYEKLILKYSSLKVILCHARPFKEAIFMLEKNENCFVDTAFLSIQNVDYLTENGFEDRVIYGSDFPINNNSKITNSCDFTIDKLKNKLSLPLFNKLVNDNYLKCFH